jgi:hypothetical protein
MRNILLLFCFLATNMLVAQDPVFLQQFDGTTETPAPSTYGDGYTRTRNNGELILTRIDNTTNEYVQAGVVLTSPTSPIDVTGNLKVYIRAKSSVAGTVLRMDIKDTNGRSTNLNAASATLNTEYAIYEFDYTGKLFDAYSGAPCSTSMPCDVNAAIIDHVQIYVNPGVKMNFASVTLDYISVGSPIFTEPTCTDGIKNGGEIGIDCGGPTCPSCPQTCTDGVMNGDETGVDCGGATCPPCVVNNNPTDWTTTFTGMSAAAQVSSSDKFTSTLTGDRLKISGSGSTNQYEAVTCNFFDAAGMPILIKANPNNKLVIRARITSRTASSQENRNQNRSVLAPTLVRIDLQDNLNRATTNGSVAQIITNEWSDIEFDFTGKYQDGGYGGTGCTAGPCPVDPLNLARMVIYPNFGLPSTSSSSFLPPFDGVIEIDGINFNGSSAVAASLPIDLIDFKAESTDKSNLLTWSTANELNFSHFEVMKSKDAIKYEKIGQVAGQDQPSYEFTDSNPFSGMNYYKLNMVDLDGSQKISKAVYSMNTSNGVYAHVQNPATNNEVMIYTNYEQPKITLYNHLGQVVKNNVSKVGDDSYKINTQSIAKGLHIVKISSNGDNSSYKVFID